MNLINHQSPITNHQLGLVGYPLGHSLSPQIHAAALRACGLQGSYLPFTIYPTDKQGLKDILAKVRSGELHGLNVTIPHKENVIPFLDELTPTAQAIGAVNTIYMRKDKLIGDNTDAPGFLADLRRFLSEDQLSNVNRQSSLVMGVGGSARAVVHALLKDGWNVTLVARRIEQAQQLAASFTNYQPALSVVEGLPITALTNLPLSTFHLLVNTTPLGMTPNIDSSPLLEGTTLTQGTIVYDLVYSPRETKLVRDAKAQGCHAITGLGMLIEQAALSFEIWTGHKPPRDILYASVVG